MLIKCLINIVLFFINVENSCAANICMGIFSQGSSMNRKNIYLKYKSIIRL